MMSPHNIHLAHTLGFSCFFHRVHHRLRGEGNTPDPNTRRVKKCICNRRRQGRNPKLPDAADLIGAFHRVDLDFRHFTHPYDGIITEIR